MKKTLYLLLTIIVFTACGGDDPDPIQTKFDNWNDPASTHYTDGKYNPIAGEWQLIQRNGESLAISEFLIYKFDSSFSRSEAKTEPAEEQHPQYSNAKKYVLNNKEYKIDNTICQYAIAGTLENVRLTIKEGTNTLTFKPYESKVWTWKGDWNSPSDPHYATYNGKYNPIKGTWKLTHEGGVPVNDNRYYSFTDDFIWKQGYNSTPNTVLCTYQINDIGIKDTKQNYIFKFTVNNNILSIQGQYPNKGTGLTFIKYN